MPDASDRLADFIEALGMERPTPTPERAAAAAKALRAVLWELGFVDTERHEADIDQMTDRT